MTSAEGKPDAGANEADLCISKFPRHDWSLHHQLRSQLGLSDDVDLHCCGGKDRSNGRGCWVLDQLIRLNEIISRGRIQLIEEHPGEVTLCSWNTSCYRSSCLSHRVILFLVEHHSCIVHFNFGRVRQAMMKEILSAMSRRTDLLSFSVTEVIVTSTGYGLRWGGSSLPCCIEQGIIDLIDDCNSLTAFELHEDKMRPSGAERLGLILSHKRSLKKLSLRNEYGIRVFLESCSKQSPDDVNLEHICFPNCNSMCMTHLAEVLVTNTTITYLDLSGNRWLSYGCSKDDGITAIARALHSSKSVETLILVNASIGPRGLKALADMLLENTSLSSLDISQNYVPSDECVHVAEAVRSTTTLKMLKLHDCRICFAGVKSILLALKENCSGLSVDFGSHWSIDCTPLEVLDLILAEKVDRVPFNWTAGIIKKIGYIPEWCQEVRVSLSNDNLRANKLLELKQYLQSASAKVSSLNVRCSEGSEQVCLRLAGLLSRRGTIEELELNCKPVHVNVLKEFAEAAAANTRLRKLRFGMFTRQGMARPVGIIKSIPLADTLRKSKTLEAMECDLIFNRHALREFSKHLEENYALTELKFCIRNENFDIVRKRHHIGRRNTVLQQQALHFVLCDTMVRRWAEAFSLTHDTATLRRKVQEATGKCAEDAECLVRAKWFTLCINFFKITEVVKERIVCNLSSPGAMQIDRLDLPLLAHVASFLKVHDIKVDSSHPR